MPATQKDSLIQETSKPGGDNLAGLMRLRDRCPNLGLLLYCFERSCCQPAVAYFGGYGPLRLCLIEHIAVCLAIRIDQSPPFRLGKRQFPDFRIVVDDNEVPGRYLLGG